MILSRCAWFGERSDRLHRVAGKELEKDGNEERHDDEHNDELHDASQNASQTVLLSGSYPATPGSFVAFDYLLTHMPETG